MENINAFKYLSNDIKLSTIRQIVGKLLPKIKTLHTFLTYILDYNLLLKAIASTTVCTVIQVCCERSEQKKLSYFRAFHFQKMDSVKKGDFNEATILM